MQPLEGLTEYLIKPRRVRGIASEAVMNSYHRQALIGGSERYHLQMTSICGMNEVGGDAIRCAFAINLVGLPDYP